MSKNDTYYRSGAIFKIKGDWSKQSKLLQETYPALTAEDLSFVLGHEEGLLQRVEDRLLLSREEVMRILSKAFPRQAVQMRFKTRRNLTGR